MERWKEGLHQKGKIFSWFIQGRLKLLDVMQS